MRGAIYVSEVNDFQINNCDFKYNDGGPIFNAVQRIDTLDSTKEVNRASAILLGSDTIEASITLSTFESNQN
jgi:hypothetical protein